MRDRELWARLLPDFRTLYVGFAELERFRNGGTMADAFLRAMTYAEELFKRDPAAEERVEHLLRESGLPRGDRLARELCRALVTREALLRERPREPA